MLGAFGDEIAPTLRRLGFETTIFDNPLRGGPILIAERREPGAVTTVLGYGHGDDSGSARNGATGCRRGSSPGRATGSTAAVPPTTRASTRST